MISPADEQFKRVRLTLDLRVELWLAIGSVVWRYIPGRSKVRLGHKDRTSRISTPLVVRHQPIAVPAHMLAASVPV